MLVRSNPTLAARALGFVQPTVRKLVGWNALDGDLNLPPGKAWVEYDPSWSSLDIWQRFEGRGYAFADEVDALVPGLIRKTLGLGGEPWSDAYLEALVAVRGGRRLTAVEATKVLPGARTSQEAATGRYAELVNGRKGDLPSHPPMEVDELMDGAPEPFQALGGTCLDRDRGMLFERPLPAWVARVGAMPEGNPRWVATLTILAHPTHGGLQVRVPEMLGLLESLANGVGGRPLSDAGAVEAVLRAMMAGSGGTCDGDGAGGGRVLPAGLAAVRRYAELRELVSAYLDWQKPDPETEEGAFLLALLPAELPKDLRKLIWRKTVAVSAATLRARATTAGEVARRASTRLLCVEGRLRQWDRLCKVADGAIAGIEADLDAGRPVMFPVRVSDTYKVIRPDGSIAPGLKQQVDLEIVPEDQVWLETAVASGWALNVRRSLGAAALAGSPAGLRAAKGGRPPPGDGRFHRPGGDRRFHVRYVGTSPSGDDGDEHHAPHLIGLYVVSALVHETKHMTLDAVRERNRVVDAQGLERASQAMMGLTWWNEDTRVAHLALRHAGQVLLPYRQLRLTLAYGCAVARMELMSGLRIGETMQARHGGCFANVDLQGRAVATMRGRPKGWRRDRLWMIDARTMTLLKAIKAWVVANWHADLGVLPIVAYGVRARNRERMQCPPARYLFQIGGGHAARNEHLNRCLRIATLGMPHALSHDYRYAFGKLLKMREATRRQRARALSHEEGSPMVDHYGDWDCEGLEDGDMVVAEHQDALAREMLEELLLAS